MIHQVIEFNKTILGIEPRPVGFMPDHEFDHLVKALHEEISEFQMASVNGDLIGTVDALNDLVYFALGGLYKMGIPGEVAIEIFSAIHEANMTKKRGVVERRGDGTAPDAIKPEGWMSPEARIAAIIDKHMG